MSHIVDHWSDKSAVKKEGGFITHGSNEYRCKTTKGWKILLSWKDGSPKWEILNDIKESNSVNAAEYSVANRIADDHSFAWKIPF